MDSASVPCLSFSFFFVFVRFPFFCCREKRAIALSFFVVVWPLCFCPSLCLLYLLLFPFFFLLYFSFLSVPAVATRASESSTPATTRGRPGGTISFAAPCRWLQSPRFVVHRRCVLKYRWFTVSQVCDTQGLSIEVQMVYSQSRRFAIQRGYLQMVYSLPGLWYTEAIYWSTDGLQSRRFVIYTAFFSLVYMYIDYSLF